MRVIAGSHRGRRLRGPEGVTLRPTSDKVRGALFSILGSRVPGARFLDVYAGTGAVGIEAMSRGAGAVTFVESDAKAIQLLRSNLITCQLLRQVEIHVGPAHVFITRPNRWGGPYDIVFADPPYAAKYEIDVLRQAWEVGLVSANGVMVIEQDSKIELPASLGHAALLRRYVYGDTALFLYVPADIEAMPS